MFVPVNVGVTFGVNYEHHSNSYTQTLGPKYGMGGECATIGEDTDVLSFYHI